MPPRRPLFPPISIATPFCRSIQGRFAITGKSEKQGRRTNRGNLRHATAAIGRRGLFLGLLYEHTANLKSQILNGCKNRMRTAALAQEIRTVSYARPPAGTYTKPRRWSSFFSAYFEQLFSGWGWGRSKVWDQPRTHFRKIPENFFCSWSTLKTAAPLAIAAVRYLGAIAGPSWSQKAMRGATARGAASHTP